MFVRKKENLSLSCEFLKVLFFLFSPTEPESRSGRAFYETGENWKRLFWRGVQRHWPSDSESGCHKNHWSGRSWRWDRGHSTRNHSAESVWQSLRNQILRILPEGKAWKWERNFPWPGVWPSWSRVREGRQCGSFQRKEKCSDLCDQKNLALIVLSS